MFLTIEIKLSLSSFDLLIIIEVGLRIEHWIVVSIFLLIFPNGFCWVVLVLKSVVHLVHCQSWIRSNVLSKRFLDNFLN